MLVCIHNTNIILPSVVPVYKITRLNCVVLTVRIHRLNSLALTMRLDSELEVVLALPRDLSTVNAAAKCLNASVSGPPPATSNS